jgi:hypothetical protein
MPTNHHLSNLHTLLLSTFQNKPFTRPYFYNHPGGLRFELSEGGSAINQFLSAMRKATLICQDIFPPDQPITVRLQTYDAARNPFQMRNALAQLHHAGINIPRQRSLWTTPLDPHMADFPGLSLHIAFDAPPSLLPNLLWCAFVADFGAIQPRPPCDVFLHNLPDRILVHPYDDRGMDVVGPNHPLLSKLYAKHNPLLLDYDRQAMQATFGPPPPKSP